MSETENDPVSELVETVADDLQADEDRLVSLVEGATGLSIDDVSDDDAEKLLEAWDDRDADRFGEIAGEYDGVDGGEVAAFVAQAWDEIAKAEGSDDAGNSGASDSEPSGQSRNGAAGGGSGSGLTREEVREIAREQSEQVADQVVTKLENRLTGGGGGDVGENEQNQLAQIISLANLFGGGGGNGLGEQIQEQATQRFVQKAFTPDPGEIMGRMMAMQQYRKMAEDMGMEVDNDLMQNQMKSMFESPIYGTDDDSEE